MVILMFLKGRKHDMDKNYTDGTDPNSEAFKLVKTSGKVVMALGCCWAYEYTSPSASSELQWIVVNSSVSREPIVDFEQRIEGPRNYVIS